MTSGPHPPTSGTAVPIGTEKAEKVPSQSGAHTLHSQTVLCECGEMSTANVDRDTRRPHTTASWALLGVIVLVIAASVVVEVWVAPRAIVQVADVFPETRPFQTLGFVWTGLTFSSWQALLVLVLVGDRFHHQGRSVTAVIRWAFGLLALIVLLAITALIVLSILSFATPAVMLALIAMAVVAAAGILVVILVRYAR